jgi:hypothetical protein
MLYAVGNSNGITVIWMAVCRAAAARDRSGNRMGVSGGGFLLSDRYQLMTTVFRARVPALTGSADIKLNTRLSLRAPMEKIPSRTGRFPDPPSLRKKQPPADGLV